MAFCTNCGAQLPDGARFCSQCGASQTVTASTVTAAATVASNVYTVDENSVMLVSLGTCDASTASLLLQETCGYTASDASLIVSSTPITLAQNLTQQQADVLAQALTEYGMEVTVFDASGYRTVTPTYSTVYDTTGSLLSSAAAILGLIGVGNRLTRAMIRRHDYPYRFAGARPPMMVMPRGHMAPPPRRQPMPMPHRPEPRPVEPVHRPEPRPMGGMRQPESRPMGGNRGGAMGGPQGGSRGGAMGGPQGGNRGGNRGGSMGGPGGSHGGPMGGPGGHR